MIASLRWDGAPISTPGIYHDLPLARYHRGDIAVGPSVSSTVLRLLWSQSPKHAWAHNPLNPNRIAQDGEAAHYVLGRAVHHLAVGEVDFKGEFIVRPTQAPDGRDWHGSNKSCIKWIADQKRQGKTILTPQQVEQIRGMAVSLSEYPLVREGILNGLIERSLIWQDKETGLWLKARPDAIPTDSGDFCDLKTTESTLYKRLQQSLASYNYQMQAGLVIEGARTLGLETHSFTFLWVETGAPHDVRATTLRDDDIARGIRQNRVCLRVFADCLASGRWPGPGDDRPDAEPISLPDWASASIDNRLQYELREAA